MNTPQYNRNPMPQARYTPNNPVMANQISENAAFKSLAHEVAHERAVNAMKWVYTYTLSETVPGQSTQPFNIQIEQGTDFECKYMSISTFSYDDQNDTDYPIPNSLGATAWAGRGLSILITDTRSGRNLTSGYVPIELIASPAYGINMQSPIPFKYFFWRNTKIKFDIRNRDNANRTHEINIALHGYKVATPGQ